MDEGSLDFGQLETFLAVVDQRGVQKAAISLEVSQPSVSQQIRRLEHKLGHKLFRRRGRSVALTTEGEALVLFARALFRVSEDIRNYFRQAPGEGLLRIGLTEDFARTILPRVVNLFSSAHPNFQIEVVCDTSSAKLFQALDDGTIDLAVGKGVNGYQRGRHLMSEPIVWLARPPHAPVQDPIPLVLPTAPSDTRSIILDTLQKAERSWRVKFQSASLASLEGAVQSGIGISAAMRSLQSSLVAEMSAACGLPSLPNAEYYLDRTAADAHPSVEAFAAIIFEVVPALFPQGVVRLPD